MVLMEPAPMVLMAIVLMELAPMVLMAIVLMAPMVLMVMLRLNLGCFLIENAIPRRYGNDLKITPGQLYKPHLPLACHFFCIYVGIVNLIRCCRNEHRLFNSPGLL